ncbi:MAG: hypothetical protein IIB87_01910 [Chloroflexi bacterium]|nr:hypothetical protein [Chloroflexota bacterium]
MSDQAPQQPDQAPPPPSQDMAEIWREWLTQTERQFNAFFNQSMNTEPFARSMGGYTEMTAAYQRMVTEGMQRYLTFMNMPSRTDVISLGETLRTIEDRLGRIEETLQIAAAAVEMSDDRSVPRREPVRTRRPPGFPLADEAQPIPEGMRR